MKRHSRRCGKETGNFRRNAGQGGGAHWHGYSSTQYERGRNTQLGPALFTPHQQPGNNIYSLIPFVPQYLTPRTALIQQNPLGERWENVHAIPHLFYSLLSLSPRPNNRIKMPRTPAATSPRPQRNTTSDNTGTPDLSAPTPSSGRACPQQLQPQPPQARWGTLCSCVSLRLVIWLYLPVVFVRGAYPGSMLLGSPSLIQENEVRQVSVGKAVAPFLGCVRRA